jgi:signal transduction histidine kinase
MASSAPIDAALYAAIGGSPLPVAVYDCDLRYVEVNEAFASIHQLPRDAFLNRSVGDVIPDLAEVISGALRHVFATGKPLIDYQMAGARAHQSHEARHWSVTYLPVADDRAVTAVIALVRESTAEVRARRLLDAQKLILEQLARGDTLRDVLEMIVTSVRACSVDGFLPSILLLDEAHGVLRHGASAGLPEEYDRALDGSRVGPTAGSCGTAAYRGERVVVADIDTDPLWEGFRHLAAPFGLRACWSAPIIASTGRVLGTFALYYREPRLPSVDDLNLVELVTRTTALAIELRRGADERQQLLEAEQAARREAEAASRSKDEFVAALSHELRTPLNAIQGWVSMLKAGTLREGGATRAVDAIERNTVAQRRLVEDLLDASRIVTGKMSVTRTPIDLGGVVDAAVETVRLAAEGKQLEIEIDRQPGAYMFDGDYDRLKQAVCNLLTNAIKFTPPSGRVTVELHQSAATAEITVRDTGCGMPPELVPHVFERFRQGDRTASTSTSGLGLGLAIADHIIGLHDGSIEAASAGIGCGSTFRVVFTRRSPAASAVRD